MGAWHSPQSIFALGHRAIRDLFTVPVQLQEKVDGSFFAFGYFPDSYPDESLKVRSKGAVMSPLAPPDMFKPAVEAVKHRFTLLHPEWQYRGETLAKPKHNALSYDRAPIDNIILFDICTEEETYLPYEELAKEAKRLGLEVVPQLFHGKINSPDELRKYLDTTSVLGGQKIEGVVIKPLEPMFGQDKKLLMGKFVSEAFKEVHRKEWGESNPGTKEIIQRLGDNYKSPARFQKALIHLREAGEISGSVQDIERLIREIPRDIKKECEDEIKEALFKYAWPHISRMVVSAVPAWYKNLLLELQFSEQSEEDPTFI